MEAGLLEDIASHEQANALRPIEVGYFGAETTAVLARGMRSL